MKTTIAIAGGSLAGLMTALELRAAGAEVEVFERSQRVLDDRGAGIVMQAETLEMLTARGTMQEAETGVWLSHRQYLNGDGSVALRQPMPQLMTSWGLLFQSFRREFGPDHYHEDAALEHFTQVEDGITALFHGLGEVQASLLVGADGARSFVRKTQLPAVSPSYAGYVAWRGVIPESSLDPVLMKTFADHFTFQQMPHSHALCYLIPGAHGETAPGHRRLNWLWYWNVLPEALPALMTGRDGLAHDFSVPPGEIATEFLAKQATVARELLSPQFLELWNSTRDPFLQPILDLAVPRMVHGRVALVGDAAFIPRPHTAASTSKAAANALGLGAAWIAHAGNVPAVLRAWEPGQLALGRQLESHGKTLGHHSQFA